MATFNKVNPIEFRLMGTDTVESCCCVTPEYVHKVQIDDEITFQIDVEDCFEDFFECISMLPKEPEEECPSEDVECCFDWGDAFASANWVHTQFSDGTGVLCSNYSSSPAGDVSLLKYYASPQSDGVYKVCVTVTNYVSGTLNLYFVDTLAASTLMGTITANGTFCFYISSITPLDYIDFVIPQLDLFVGCLNYFSVQRSGNLSLFTANYNIRDSSGSIVSSGTGSAIANTSKINFMIPVTAWVNDNENFFVTIDDCSGEFISNCFKLLTSVSCPTILFTYFNSRNYAGVNYCEVDGNGDLMVMQFRLPSVIDRPEYIDDDFELFNDTIGYSKTKEVHKLRVDRIANWTIRALVYMLKHSSLMSNDGRVWRLNSGSISPSYGNKSDCLATVEAEIFVTGQESVNNTCEC